MVPTPVPTPLPTPNTNPTSLPTSWPTEAPTPLPTLLPTSTLAPTAYTIEFKSYIVKNLTIPSQKSLNVTARFDPEIMYDDKTQSVYNLGNDLAYPSRRRLDSSDLDIESDFHFDATEAELEFGTGSTWLNSLYALRKHQMNAKHGYASRSLNANGKDEVIEAACLAYPKIGNVYPDLTHMTYSNIWTGNRYPITHNITRISRGWFNVSVDRFYHVGDSTVYEPLDHYFSLIGETVVSSLLWRVACYFDYEGGLHTTTGNAEVFWVDDLVTLDETAPQFRVRNVSSDERGLTVTVKGLIDEPGTVACYGTPVNITTYNQLSNYYSPTNYFFEFGGTTEVSRYAFESTSDNMVEWTLEISGLGLDAEAYTWGVSSQSMYSQFAIFCSAKDDNQLNDTYIDLYVDGEYYNSLTNEISLSDIFSSRMELNTSGSLCDIVEYEYFGHDAISTEVGDSATLRVALRFRDLTSGQVLLGFESSDKTEGMPSLSTNPFGAMNIVIVQASFTQWHYIFYIGQRDNEYDGDIEYNATMTLLYSSAPEVSDWLTTGESCYLPLINKDANTDDEETTPTIAIQVSLQEGSRSYTTELGGRMILQCKLNATIKGAVTFAVTTSNPAEGIVTFPSNLVFTEIGWDSYQYIYVQGVFDEYLDFDQIFDVELYLIASEDPSWVNAKMLTNAKYENVVNRGSPWEWVAVYIDQNNCFILGENGYSCDITVSLCRYPLLYNDTTQSWGCSGEITQDYLFDRDVYNVVVEFQIDPKAEFEAEWTSTHPAVTIDGLSGKVEFTEQYFSASNYSINITLSPLNDGQFELDNAEIQVTNFAYLYYYDESGVSNRYPATSNWLEADNRVWPNLLLYSNADYGEIDIMTLSETSCTIYEGETCDFTISSIALYERYDAQTISASVPDLLDGTWAPGYISLLSYANLEGTPTESASLVSGSFFPGPGSMIIRVHALTDYYDDYNGMKNFTVQIDGEITGKQYVDCTFTWPRQCQARPTPIAKTDTDRQFFTVNIMNSDNAGLTFTQNGWSKSFLSETTIGTQQTINLPEYQTSENNGTVVFGLNLLSKPIHPVRFDITPSKQNPTGGISRFEALPEGSSYYPLKRTATASGNGSYLEYPTNENGFLTIEFTSETWNITQHIVIKGLDDNYRDGDTSFTTTVVMNSTNLDPNYQDMTFVFEMVNLDDDVANVQTTFFTTNCSEPYYGDTAEGEMVLTSEPMYPVVIGLSSSNPEEAQADKDVIFFDKNNWYIPQAIAINSIDDLIDDGDITLFVICSVLASYDVFYVSLGIFANQTIISRDDPDEGLVLGLAKPNISISDLSLAKETSESGGVVTLAVNLPTEPLDTVIYGITVDDPTEAIAYYPSMLIFTPELWSNTQLCYIKGISDEDPDGDVSFNVIFYVISTDDPYFMNNKETTYELVNADDPVSKVGVDFSPVLCDMWEAGSEKLSCVITFQLCDVPSSGPDNCSVYAYNEMVFGQGLASVNIRVTLSDTTETIFSPDISSKVNSIASVNVDELLPEALEFSFIAGTGPFIFDITILSQTDNIRDGNKAFFLDMVESKAIGLDSKVYDFGNNQIYNNQTAGFVFDNDTTLMKISTGQCKWGRELSEDGEDCLMSVRLSSRPIGGLNFTLVIEPFALSAIASDISQTAYFCNDLSCQTGWQPSVDISFTDDNWDTSQFFMVSSYDDAEYEATGYYDVVFSYENIQTTDPGWLKYDIEFYHNGTTSTSFHLHQYDNEMFGLEVRQLSLDGSLDKLEAGNARDSDENGATQQLELSLSDSPTQDVLVPIRINDESILAIAEDGNPWSALAKDSNNISYVTFPSGCATSFVIRLNYWGVDDDITNGTRSGVIRIGPTTSTDQRYEAFLFQEVFVEVYDNDLVTVNTLSASTDEAGLQTEVIKFEIPYGTWPDYENFEDYRGKFTNQAMQLISYHIDYIQVTVTLPDTEQAYFNTSSLNYVNISDADIVFTESSVIAIFRNGLEGTFSFEVLGQDDLIDDGHTPYRISSIVDLYFPTDLYGAGPTTYDFQNAPGMLSRKAKSYNISGLTLDDDTGGIQVSQLVLSTDGNDTFTQYKSYNLYKQLNLDSADPVESYPTIILPDNKTNEQYKKVSFNFSLLSEPIGPVTVQVRSLPPDPVNGGSIRYEGIPVDWDGPTKYEVISMGTASKVAFQQGKTEDIVQNAGYHEYTFDKTNWTELVSVTIMGLNDFIDDYSMTYLVYLEVSSNDDEIYDTMSDIFIPFENENDDFVGWEVTAESECQPANCPVYQDGFVVTTESYYGFRATITIDLYTKPKDSLLITMTSTHPDKAGPLTTLLVISPEGWDTTQEITVFSVEDFVLGGDFYYNVTVGMLFSPDEDYGTAEPNPEGIPGKMSNVLLFYGVDDPTDSSTTMCSRGYYGKYPNCNKCPMGKFANDIGDKTSCRSCPPGTFGVVTGAISMEIGVDDSGASVDPGCIPCPDGTFNEFWGQTRCIRCAENVYTTFNVNASAATCGPLGTVHPILEKHVQGLNTVGHNWDSLEPEEFEQELFDFIAMKSKTQTAGDVQLNLVFVGLIIFTFILTMIYLIKPFIRYQDWVIIKARIVKMDCFESSHLPITEDEEEEAENPTERKRLIGGFTNLASQLVSFLVIIFMIYDKQAFPNEISQALVPNSNKDEIGSDLIVEVTFMAYTGCDYSIEPVPYSDIEISSQGVEVIKSQVIESYCIRGSLYTKWDVREAFFTSAPSITYKITPPCPACADTGRENIYQEAADSEIIVNPIYECSNCSIASVSWIEYNIESGALFGGSEYDYATVEPDMFNEDFEDDNSLMGKITPITEGSVIRGSSESELEVVLIPTKYVSFTEGNENFGYRVQYGSQSFGDIQVLNTVNDIKFYDGDGLDPTDYMPLITNYFVDTDYLDTTTENEVNFVINMPKSQVLLLVEVKMKIFWLDFFGIMTGITSLISMIFVMVMTTIEGYKSPRSIIYKVRVVIFGEPTVGNENKKQGKDKKKDNGLTAQDIFDKSSTDLKKDNNLNIDVDDLFMVQSPDRKAVMRKRYNDLEENEHFPTDGDDFYEEKDTSYEDQDSSYDIDNSKSNKSMSLDDSTGQKRVLEAMEDYQNIYNTDVGTNGINTGPTSMNMMYDNQMMGMGFGNYQMGSQELNHQGVGGNEEMMNMNMMMMNSMNFNTNPMSTRDLNASGVKTEYPPNTQISEQETSSTRNLTNAINPLFRGTKIGKTSGRQNIQKKGKTIPNQSINNQNLDDIFAEEDNVLSHALAFRRKRNEDEDHETQI